MKERVQDRQANINFNFSTYSAEILVAFEFIDISKDVSGNTRDVIKCKT